MLLCSRDDTKHERVCINICACHMCAALRWILCTYAWNMDVTRVFQHVAENYMPGSIVEYFKESAIFG